MACNRPYWGPNRHRRDCSDSRGSRRKIWFYRQAMVGDTGNKRGRQLRRPRCAQMRLQAPGSMADPDFEALTISPSAAAVIFVQCLPVGWDWTVVLPRPCLARTFNVRAGGADGFLLAVRFDRVCGDAGFFVRAGRIYGRGVRQYDIGKNKRRSDQRCGNDFHGFVFLGCREREPRDHSVSQPGDLRFIRPTPKTGHWAIQIRPLGVEVGQYRISKKNILRTENKWGTSALPVDSGGRGRQGPCVVGGSNRGHKEREI